MSDSDMPRRAAKVSFKGALVELTIVAVLGATVGVAFEVGRTGAPRTRRPTRRTSGERALNAAFDASSTFRPS